MPMMWVESQKWGFLYALHQFAGHIELGFDLAFCRIEFPTYFGVRDESVRMLLE